MRVLLTALFVLVVLALGLSLTALTYNRMKEASLGEARSLFDRTSNALAQTIVENRLEIAYGLAVAAGSSLAGAPAFPQRFAAKDALLGVLQSNPLIRNAYVGWPDGEFLLMRRVLRSDRPPAPTAARTAFFFLRGVERSGQRLRARSWFYDERMRLLAVREEPGFRFDPRTRTWFTTAAPAVRVTAPYLSFGNGRMGVSLTKRSAYGSVFAADVDLNTLSDSLARLRPTPSSLAALISPTGVVLGYSDPERLLEINRGRRDRPATVTELDAPPIFAAFASASSNADTRGTYTDPRGRTWLFGVVPGRDAEGKVLGYDPNQRTLSRLLILSIPEDELLSTAIRVRNESLLLCLALIFTMVPLAYLLSQLIAHPMVGLRDDALSLRNLDFSERPPRTSVISEIGEFSDTFGAMRSHIREHNDAAAHFVPREFLELLERRDLRSLQLGDHTERVMTMLFSDIRAFTTLSGTMTPEETFRFVNSYLTQIGPLVRENNGFIDKYIGDAIFALFPNQASHGVEAAIAMQRRLVTYNEGRARAGYAPIAIGVGVHHGTLMLGTIGEARRFETTVISDAVNIAARMEGLTKNFGALILISGAVAAEIRQADYTLRSLGNVLLKGATHSVAVYEVCDADPAELLAHKRQTLALFEMGRQSYERGDFEAARLVFSEIAQFPGDRPAIYFRDRATFMASAIDVIEWDGVEHMETK